MKHLAIIPDGNRRWAQKSKNKNFTAYNIGADAFLESVKFCLKSYIKYLSFYAFSLENFDRMQEEKIYILNLVVEYIKERLPEFIKWGVQIRFIGQRDFYPEQNMPTILMIEKKTKNLDKLIVNLLFCYGSKQEIATAIKIVAASVKEGAFDIEDIDENLLRQNFGSGNIPDPELVIRTGGKIRLSNFLLFQAAYSEFLSLDCFWPEVTQEHLAKCLKRFDSIQRNFGK